MCDEIITGKSKKVDVTKSEIHLHEYFFRSAKEEVSIISSSLRPIIRQYRQTGMEEFTHKFDDLLHIGATKQLFNLRLNILLRSSPFIDKNELRDEILIKLIKAGADIRYKKIFKSESLFLLKKEVFITDEYEIEKPPKNGLYYITDEDDPLLHYFKNRFVGLFESAKKICIDKNGRLCYAGLGFIRLIKIISENKSFIISAILAIIGIILTSIGLYLTLNPK
jgi:hypothetical protein